MKQGKETKVRESASRDPQLTGFNPDEFFENKLSLQKDLKDFLMEKGLDWRFINADQFRSSGGTHRAHWKPYKFDGELAQKYVMGPDGFIRRGDLILAVREKAVTKLHKEHLRKRTNLQSNSQQIAAQELRKMSRDAGMADQSRVIEGYEDNE